MAQDAGHDSGVGTPEPADDAVTMPEGREHPADRSSVSEPTTLIPEVESSPAREGRTRRDPYTDVLLRRSS
ncbi:MAG: hypothetical protein GXX79_06170 [Actinomycetales bacterium]|nr:hypothetical protein [Actinomycetales bacterium]